ncbi:MAG: glutamate dehydrogenase, partial [Sphingomonadales bacterium]
MKNMMTSLTRAFEARLLEGALPGELEGFDEAERAEAADFVADTAAVRGAGTPRIALATFMAGERRRMRLAVINDDMPFLVDSISAAIAAEDIAIARILHPVIAVTRDADGKLESIGPEAPGARRESMVYIEMERVDARTRRELVAELERTLDQVREAVNDWRALQTAMAADAAAVPSKEGAKLLRWFHDGAMTLLAHENWAIDGTASDQLGLSRFTLKTPILAEASRMAAVEWFRQGGEAPLLLKSNSISTVHRRVPLDIVVVPIVTGSQVTGLSIHAGLWTSAALFAAPDDVPVLRERLSKLEQKFGFDPKGHTGKAMAHALTALPHDLTTAFDIDSLERLVLTSMSVADRPRSKLILVKSPLGRHLFAFVWLPRDEITTSRREAVGEMLSEAAHASLINWSIALEDGVVALLRYTLDLRQGGTMPDADKLDDRLERMMRGWVPAVEAALGEQVGAASTRLALRFANAFPAAYRATATPEEAARDILRIATLEGPNDRSVRITRADAPGEYRVKLYA